MRILSDIRYGALVQAEDPTLTLRGRPQRRLATLQLCASSHRADLIVTNQGTRSVPGVVILAAYLTVTRQRKLVLTEFLPGIRRGWKGRIATLAYRLLLSRACCGIQVMTEWEKADYASRYRIPSRLLRHIPFYFYDDRIVNEPRSWDPEGRHGVFSSGRNSCDWDTVLDAAVDTDWPLTVVCTAPERERIGERASEAGVTVLSDVPRPEHDEMLDRTALYLLCLKERSISAGHVRLMAAATRGVPLIATEVTGLAGYEGLAVAVVPPGDANALRVVVGSLLSDDAEIRRRMAEVTALAATRPFSRYADELRAFIADSAAVR